jgi:hypothetical protein
VHARERLAAIEEPDFQAVARLERGRIGLRNELDGGADRPGDETVRRARIKNRLDVLAAEFPAGLSVFAVLLAPRERRR